VIGSPIKAFPVIALKINGNLMFGRQFLGFFNGNRREVEGIYVKTLRR